MKINNDVYKKNIMRPTLKKDNSGASLTGGPEARASSAPDKTRPCPCMHGINI